MNCQTADLLIQKHLDGMLSLPERAALDAHVAECAVCRAAWDQYRALAQQTSDWVSRAGQSTLSDADFSDRLYAQIAGRAADHAAHDAATRPFPASIFTGRWAFAFGAVSVGLIAVSVLLAPKLPVSSAPLHHLALPPVTALNGLPLWLLHTISEMGVNMLSDFGSASHLLTPLSSVWSVSLLALLILINGLFYRRARLTHRRQPLS